MVKLKNSLTIRNCFYLEMTLLKKNKQKNLIILLSLLTKIFNFNIFFKLPIFFVFLYKTDTVHTFFYA